MAAFLARYTTRARRMPPRTRELCLSTLRRAAACLHTSARNSKRQNDHAKNINRPRMRTQKNSHPHKNRLYANSIDAYFSGELDSARLDDFKTIATVGIGGFGRVNLVNHIDSGRVYALKCLNKAHIVELNQQEHVLNERSILLSVRSDHIVRLYKTWRTPERLYMLMQHLPGGE